MTIFDNYEVWFVIGSQHLLRPGSPAPGDEACRTCGEQPECGSQTAVQTGPSRWAPPRTRSPHICRDANYDDKCAGLVVWLHTFSPAKMWINGLTILNKPLLQFHTQYNAALPWDSIDMDFMNPEPDRARRPRVRLHRRPHAPTAQRGHRPLAG